MNNRRTVMIVVVIVCLGVASAIAWTNRPQKKAFGPSEPTLMLCCESDCGHVFDVAPADYTARLKEVGPRGAMAPIAFACPQCQKMSGYAAFRCPKCEHVFIKGASGNDFADRCPACNYSATEEMRQNR